MLDKIMNYTLANGGGTFTRDGQATMFLNGYQVSIKDVLILNDPMNASLINFDELLDSLSDGQYLGTWIDDNKLYIDVSIYVRELEHALKIADTFEQLAILDWSTMDNIYLNK